MRGERHEAMPAAAGLLWGLCAAALSAAWEGFSPGSALDPGFVLFLLAASGRCARFQGAMIAPVALVAAVLSGVPAAGMLCGALAALAAGRLLAGEGERAAGAAFALRAATAWFLAVALLDGAAVAALGWILSLLWSGAILFAAALWRTVRDGVHA